MLDAVGAGTQREAAVAEGDVEHTLDLLQRLEEQPHVVELMEILTFKGKPATA